MIIVQAIIDLIAKVLGLFLSSRQQQSQDVQDQKAATVQKSAQQTQVIDDVKAAQEARAGADAAAPGELWSDDGFERKTAGPDAGPK